MLSNLRLAAQHLGLLGSLALGFVMLLSPIVVALTLFLWLSGSGGSLDDSCHPRTVGAKTLAWIAPNTFWQEQINYLRSDIERPYVAPSETYRTELAQLQDGIAAVISVASAPTQNTMGSTLTSAEQLRQQADRLREEADAIELEAQLRELDRQALAKHQLRLSKNRICLDLAVKQLQDAE